MTRDELTARHALYYDTCYLDVISRIHPQKSSKEPHKDLNYRTQAPTDHFAPPPTFGFRIAHPSLALTRHCTERPACQLHGPVTRETQRHPNGAKMAKEKGEKRKAKGGGDAGGESKAQPRRRRGVRRMSSRPRSPRTRPWTSRRPSCTAGTSRSWARAPITRSPPMPSPPGTRRRGKDRERGQGVQLCQPGDRRQGCIVLAP